jgi:hypothetical protein
MYDGAGRLSSAVKSGDVGASEHARVAAKGRSGKRLIIEMKYMTWSASSENGTEGAGRDFRWNEDAERDCRTGSRHWSCREERESEEEG